MLIGTNVYIRLQLPSFENIQTGFDEGIVFCCQDFFTTALLRSQKEHTKTWRTLERSR